MNLEDAPHHWQARADNFWLRAQRNAYRDSAGEHLTAIEQAALLPLCILHSAGLKDDRWWAAIPMLREDGAAVVTPLLIRLEDGTVTLERLEGWLAAYQSGTRSSFSVKP